MKELPEVKESVQATEAVEDQPLPLERLEDNSQALLLQKSQKRRPFPVGMLASLSEHRYGIRRSTQGVRAVDHESHSPGLWSDYRLPHHGLVRRQRNRHSQQGPPLTKFQ